MMCIYVKKIVNTYRVINKTVDRILGQIVHEKIKQNVLMNMEFQMPIKRDTGCQSFLFC